MTNDTTNTSPEQMNLESLDIGEQRRSELKSLFPGVFTETKNDKGELVESVDFEKLKAEIGTFSDLFESRRERYGMDWPGKKDSMKLIQRPSIATLKPCREESVNFDETENLFIEGDNLEVLKLLQKSYYGKVKMIYIDPPYNTGKEFIYPDNYSESLDTYLAYAGLVDDEGKKFSTNTENEGRYHTKWLNMMYPRLYLARNLLSDNGAIFISIDDNEYNNLKRLCDDIFGDENFIATVIWQKVFSPKNTAAYFSEDHDYVLVYAKNKNNWKPELLPRSDDNIARYTNPDNDERGPWMSGAIQARNYYSKGQYEVVSPSGNKYSNPKGTYWRFSQERFNELDQDNRIWWGDSGSNVPRLKRFLSEVKQGVVPQTLWTYQDVGHTQEAKEELLKYVEFENTENVLNSVKPTRLLCKSLRIGTKSQEEDIVLDFFAGSAPLAHSVLNQNLSDGGNRKFILVQLPEPLLIEESKVKTIADLGKSRIESVISEINKKLSEEKEKESESLPGTVELSIEPDLGFKVFKLDQSNFDIWDGSNPDASAEEINKQLSLYVDHIDPNSTPEDILYELLLKAGFMPTEKVEKLTLADKTVYSIAEGALLICLEEEITRELIDAVGEAEPLRFICLDKGFQGNDQLKANAVQTFAARNQGREKADQIVFRTV
jgi:adenine-specific DNA-methyltransferase